MKKPPANESSQAIKLREEALLFAEHARAPVRDDHDRQGQLRNKKLLDAAVAYARVAVPQVGGALQDMAKLLEIMMDENTSEHDLLKAYSIVKKHLHLKGIL